MNKLQIKRVWIEHRHDETPDTSWLGKFTSNASGWRLDRNTGKMLDESGTVLADKLPANWGSGAYQYIDGFQHENGSWDQISDKEVSAAFLSCRYRDNKKNGRGNHFARYGVIGWQTAATRSAKVHCLNVVYCCNDAARLEDISEGNISLVGVCAKAQIENSESHLLQVIHSGGLWGIESDSGKDYFGEVALDELASLKTELLALGLGERAIAYAFSKIEKEPVAR